MDNLAFITFGLLIMFALGVAILNYRRTQKQFKITDDELREIMKRGRNRLDNNQNYRRRKYDREP